MANWIFYNCNIYLQTRSGYVASGWNYPKEIIEEMMSDVKNS